jgi:hypothetical protein
MVRQGENMKKLLIGVLLALGNLAFTCPPDKIITHTILNPGAEPLITETAGGEGRVQVWIEMHVIRSGFSEEVKLDYDKEQLNLLQMRETEREMTFWLLVVSTGNSIVSVIRNESPSEQQQVTTFVEPMPGCFGELSW